MMPEQEFSIETKDSSQNLTRNCDSPKYELEIFEMLGCEPESIEIIREKMYSLTRKTSSNINARAEDPQPSSTFKLTRHDLTSSLLRLQVDDLS